MTFQTETSLSCSVTPSSRSEPRRLQAYIDRQLPGGDRAPVAAFFHDAILN